ncbi:MULTISPECIES: phage terminase large subunit [unclassified Bradyrhizobium]|uniref:phage terminase large subunit n=1 Tax=unclassified Bradyrhizobium TaxID=2631580 RepID=UPI000361E31E|nr:MULTISPECIES: phage terminase large subunit [unclassified Bradyrhizobium]
MSILKIPTAKIFEPLLQPARYKGVYGGRGSGKSHFFGELLVETCQAERGTLAVCIREAQRTLAQSSKRLIEGKIASLGLGHGFKLFSFAGFRPIWLSPSTSPSAASRMLRGSSSGEDGG